MDTSASWFAVVTILGVAGAVAGVRLGRGEAKRAWVATGLAAGVLAVWTWLTWHPAVAVAAIPVGVLSRIEGVASVPVFMLILGVSWGRSLQPRQRWVVACAAVIGVMHLVRGGGWMLQPTPAGAFARTIDREVVLQSQDYSCVAAASATALNRIGVFTSEAEMAALTRTTPGSGATLVRAMDGLTQRLSGTGWRVELVQPTYAQLCSLPMPVIATVQAGPLQHHMVVVESADSRHIWVLDPACGRLLYGADDFQARFTGAALILLR